MAEEAAEQPVVEEVKEEPAEPECFERDKQAIIDHLRKKKAWHAASKMIGEKKREIMEAEGISEGQALERAWDAMEVDFAEQLASYKPRRIPKKKKAKKRAVSKIPKTSPVVTVASSSSDQPIPGLTDFPESWDMSGKSTFAEDIEWIQRNRLLVVRLRPSGKYCVELSRAMEPAPSMSTIGRLETAIKFPAKFADFDMKKSVGEGDEDESNMVRRERKSIAEIYRILDQYLKRKESA